MEKLQYDKWYDTVEDLKQSINKYIVCSYVQDQYSEELWIVVPKKIERSPDGKLFNTKIYGFYLCRIYPSFRAYHTPTKKKQERESRFYCNAQQSFRLATNDEIKQLHQYWSKFRITKMK
jgi:hypothetical protein